MTRHALNPAPALPTTAPDIALPIDVQAPCGPSLEYDAEYAMLRSRMTPRGDVQYGSFVGASEAPNWAEIERDCRRLLLRSRDINLLLWLGRACTRLRQATGLARALAALADALYTWPEAIHPQEAIDGEFDPEVRANALAALADPEGLLGDVREIAVAANNLMRLTVRDVERAFAVPRPADAASPDSVTRQLAALRSAGGPDAPVHLLAQAAQSLHEIDDWCASQLGDHAPPLRPLRQVLDLFAAATPQQPETPAQPLRDGATHEAQRLPAPAMAPAAARIDPATTRQRVLAEVRAAREWFEEHEPSSPVAVLLKQAERLAGKRFSQVADAIPLDLLRRWDGEDGAIDGGLA